eukprot:scaffold132_cov170-Amphora_coffeaeformis.AAC.27
MTSNFFIRPPSIIFFAAILLFSSCAALATNRSEIYRTIRELEQFPLKQEYTSTTCQVLDVLRRWSSDEIIMTKWRSIVNKANLRHEVEESIVALHHLREWQLDTDQKDFMALDACCGKGIFSLLLSYLAPRAYPGLQRFVLFDKDKNIDWTHIYEANQNHEADGRPFMELWSGANLHKHDEIVTNLAAFQNTMAIAITGIHLCKKLSPALVGIANAVQANYLLRDSDAAQRSSVSSQIFKSKPGKGVALAAMCAKVNTTCRIARKRRITRRTVNGTVWWVRRCLLYLVGIVERWDVAEKTAWSRSSYRRSLTENSACHLYRKVQNSLKTIVIYCRSVSTSHRHVLLILDWFPAQIKNSTAAIGIKFERHFSSLPHNGHVHNMS